MPAATAPTWERVVKETVAIKGPDLADCLKECAEFAAAWAGDGNSTALKEVGSYAKQLTRRNEPEKDQLHYLAAAQLARYPNYPIMCLKALISAPDKWVTKGEAKMFNSTNVKEMGTSKAAKVAAACVCDDKARGWFGTDLTTNPAFSAKVLGNMEADELRPKTGNRRPETEGRKPNIDDRRHKPEDQLPKAEDLRPTIEGLGPET